MSYTPSHDHDHDHLASSSASLMGIDAAPSIDERVVLIDANRESPQYGSTMPSNTSGGHSCFIVFVNSSEALSTCRFIWRTLLFAELLIPVFPFFYRTQALHITVNSCKKSKVLHTLLRVDTRLFSFAVRLPQFCLQVFRSADSVHHQ